MFNFRKKMNKKKAIELTKKIWSYLAEYPQVASKMNLPLELYEEVKDLVNMCPLCEVWHDEDKMLNYLDKHNMASTFDIKSDATRESFCSDCPLKQMGHCCMSQESVFWDWEYGVSSQDRQMAAQQLLSLIEEWETINKK